MAGALILPGRRRTTTPSCCFRRASTGTHVVFPSARWMGCSRFSSDLHCPRRVRGSDLTLLRHRIAGVQLRNSCPNSWRLTPDQVYKPLMRWARIIAVRPQARTYFLPPAQDLRGKCTMSWRTPRRGSKRPLSPPAWDDPTKTAELYLVKVPVGSADYSFASQKKVNLAARSVNYIIVMVRRARGAVSRQITSLLAR